MKLFLHSFRAMARHRCRAGIYDEYGKRSLMSLCLSDNLPLLPRRALLPPRREAS